MDSYLSLVLPALMASLLLLGCTNNSQTTDSRSETSWQFYLEPELARYSQDKLNKVADLASTFDTDGLVVVVGGKLLLEFGDTTRVSYVASVRKSLLAILYGSYVEDGTINLSSTLEELDMDDVGGLLSIERKASIENLITARSGVYHPAANGGDDFELAPQRGSREPGSYFLYNNWDFNAAGGVFEKVTGQNIYDAFTNEIAKPLQFEQWDRERHRKNGNAGRSQYLAYHMNLSTRDMARIGELLLRDGRWQDKQIISESWVRRITSVVTPNNEIDPGSYAEEEFGYGYMWWVWDGPHVTCPFEGAYTAYGAFGQFITVIPKLDMVVAHKTIHHVLFGGQTTWNQYRSILENLVTARIQPLCASDSRATT